MEKQLYTTPEASQATGIPEGTIRSWLSRHPGAFEVGHHLVIEPTGRKMWTDAGIEFLKTRNTANATENATPDAANNVEHNGAQFLLDWVDADAQQLALHYWNLLPSRTLQHIRRMGIAPTSQERETVVNAVTTAAQVGIMELLPGSERKLLL